MPARRAVIFGGSGFLGRRVVEALAQDGFDAVAATPHPAGTGIAADVTDSDSVARALAGAQVAVNCVALYAETKDVSFRDVHVHGARHVATAAREAGADALVHISGIGADTGSASSYVRARGEGEKAVRDAFSGATILRPSVMFGPDDGFLNSLARIASAMPVVPLFGRGDTRLQPVFVDDVAAAVVRAAAAPSARGRTFELGGPDSVTYRALVEQVLAWTGRHRQLLPFPWAGWSLLARLGGALPRPPVTEAQVALMRHNNVARRHLPGFAELGITPRSMREIAPGYLGR